jgi:LemA protein
MGTGTKIALGVLGAIILIVLILGGSVAGTYNSLVRLDQAVQEQWAQVESQYQRRMDLIPQLVATVSGASNFEKSTLTAVVEARSKVGQVTSGALDNVTRDPQQFARFQQAQDGLSSALSRMMIVMERYPELKSIQNFSNLQYEVAGTENRIAVERMRFNETAQAFNSKRSSFPTVLIAGFFGSKFQEKPYFKAAAGAEKAPEIKF